MHYATLTWMPDLWPELNIHQEGLATGQLDQGFPWISTALEEMMGWFPNCRVCFSCSILTITFKISSQMQPLRGPLTEFCHNASLYMQNSTAFKTQRIYSNSVLCCIIKESMPYKYPIFKDENSGHLTNLGGGRWRSFNPLCNEKIRAIY
jgi:hypothetical protein